MRNKRDRVVAALQPLFEQGKYFIGQSMLEARDELLTIGSSRWDDIVDTMAYAENILTPAYLRKEEEVNNESVNRPKSFTNYGY